MNKIDFFTSDFRLNDNYSKIFSVKTNLNNKCKYNDIQIIFELIHFTNNRLSVISKKYALGVKYSNGNIINFRDFTPGILGIDCVYVLNGNNVDVYVKGSIDGAKVKGSILYISNPGYFTFYQGGKYNNLLNDKVSPEINYGDYKSYSGMSKNTFKLNFRGDKKYNCIGKIIPISMSNFSFSIQISLMECSSTTVTGQSYLFYLTLKPDDLKGNKISLSDSKNTRNLDLVVEKNETDYKIYLYNPGQYSYGTVCLNVIMYDTSSSCNFYISEESEMNSIEQISGTQIGTINNQCFITSGTPLTTEKSNLISMINELKSEIDSLKATNS